MTTKKLLPSDVIINGVYTYVNNMNYVTVLKVTRVTKKSVFVLSLLDNGKFSQYEHREGINNFSKFTYQPKFTLNS